MVFSFVFLYKKSIQFSHYQYAYLFTLLVSVSLCVSSCVSHHTVVLIVFFPPHVLSSELNEFFLSFLVFLSLTLTPFISQLLIQRGHQPRQKSIESKDWLLPIPHHWLIRRREEVNIGIQVWFQRRQLPRDTFQNSIRGQ